MALVASVIEMFGNIRLAVAANLIDGEFTRVRIGHVLVQEVEEGDPRNSLNRLYQQGSGRTTLSDRDHLENISSVTFGRGLLSKKMTTVSKSLLEKRQLLLEDQSHFWMPDQEYAMGLC
jgi:hypothetical protein